MLLIAGIDRFFPKAFSNLQTLITLYEMQDVNLCYSNAFFYFEAKLIITIMHINIAKCGPFFQNCAAMQQS